MANLVREEMSHTTVVLTQLEVVLLLAAVRTEMHKMEILGLSTTPNGSGNLLYNKYQLLKDRFKEIEETLGQNIASSVTAEQSSLERENT